MKLIIYLASHDPGAKNNYNALIDERKWTLGDENVKLQFIDIENHIVKFADEADPNFFDTIEDPRTQEMRVELIAHGDGSPWIKCMPKGQWDYTPNASNTYKDINATELRDFFRKYASKDGQYKFSELTLFCCSGYRFAKELALLMPEIQITCFKEFIKILGADGMAYPYTVVKEGNQTLIKPIDKNGEVITRPDQKHYSAAQWVLEGNAEKTIYACADAVPSQIATSSNLQDTRPVMIRGNITSSPQAELRSSKEEMNRSEVLNVSPAQQASPSEISQSEKDTPPNSPRMK